jgi:hypothetical protein
LADYRGDYHITRQPTRQPQPINPQNLTPTKPKTGQLSGVNPQTNPPQSLQCPANRPSKPDQPIGPNPPQLHQPRPNQSTGAKQTIRDQTPAKPRANQTRQTNRGQTPAQTIPNRWGPIAPQTGQTTNPGQSPAKPKQPRKRAKI